MAHVDAWRSAAAALNVQVSGPVRVTLPSGKLIEADILFHQFGARIGTLVVALDQGFAKDVIAELRSIGYVVSKFNPPADGSVFGPDDMIDLLCDWGWHGDEAAKPSWIRPSSWA